MKIKKYIILIIMILILPFYCKNGRNPTPASFFDNLPSFPISLFSLLNPYPSYKNGFSVLPDWEFNEALDFSLREESGNTTRTLKSLHNLFMFQQYGLRETMSDGSELLKRLRVRNSSSYDSMLDWFERIRKSPYRVLYHTVPINYNKLRLIYESRSYEGLTNKFNSILETMRGENVKILLIKIEDFLYKALVLNQNFKIASETFISFLWDSTVSDDRIIKNLFIKVVGEFGYAANSITGVENTKSSDVVFKRFILNLKKYFSPGGEVYENNFLVTHGESVYRNGKYPSRFRYQIAELYTWIKELFLPSTDLVKNSEYSIVEGLLENFALFEFTNNSNGVDESFLRLLQLDHLGLDRFYTVGSDVASSLETLLFLVSVVDAYGYEWNPTVTSVAKITDMASSTRTNGPKGGRLSLMDAAFNMYANLTGDIGLIKLLNDSTVEQSPFITNAKVYRDDKPFVININTPALSLLEGESRGEVSSQTDSIYTKTLPWVLSWISKVCFSGKAPFYNKNKRDSSGNYLTTDGKVYKTSDGTDLIYKSSWRTSQYRIRSRDLIWVGLGGANVVHNTGETIRLNTTDPDDGTTGWKGKSYLIPEVSYTEEQRASLSDEEALYRNFQWLLYEKRFVLTIPVRSLFYDNQVSATGSGTIQFQDGIFIIVVANGLKGLMSAKPYCTLTKCDRLDNGKWLKANEGIKSDYKVQGPLDYFSSIPGDVSMLVEVWGYGVQGAGGVYSFLDDIIFNTVYSSIVYTKSTQPSRFYGPIPPVISQLFPSIELLGFVKDNSTVDKLVPPSKVGTYWNYRNKLLPLIAAFAKTLYDQTDRDTNKNAFEYIGRLSDILSRPFLLQAQEPLARVAEPSVPEFKLLKIRVASTTTSTTPSMRSPDLDSVDYLPHSTELADSDSRSLLSFLIEDGRRQVDGIFPLISEQNLLSNLFSIFAELGLSKRSNGRKIAMKGIQLALPEVEVSSWDRTNKLNEIETSPADSKKFNFQSSIDSTEYDIIHFTDSRSSDINDSSWDDINIVLNIIYDYFSFNSPYNTLDNLNWLYEILIANKPSSSEISATFTTISSILFNDRGNRDYLLTYLINTRLPTLLYVISPDIRYLTGVVRGLLRNNGFFIFLEAKMYTVYGIKDILYDTERILTSPMIQERNSFYDSLLISAGTLLNYLADVTILGGNRPDADPYFNFYDDKNKEDKFTSYFKRLNYIFSDKY